MRPYFVHLLNSSFGTELFTYIIPNGVMMIGLGALAGTLWAARRAQRLGLEAEVVYGLAVWAAAAGFAGARLMSLVYAPELYGESPLSFFDPLIGDNAAYGGLMAGATASWLYLIRRRIASLPYLDCIAPGVGIIYFIGRMGCFLDGDDFGSATECSLAVRFPRASPAHIVQVDMGLLDRSSQESLPVHPVQIYMGFGGLAVASAGVAWSRRKSTAPGEVFVVCWLIYACARFAVEFLRGDADRGFVGPLSTSQAISIPVALLSLCALLYLRTRRLPTP